MAPAPTLVIRPFTTIGVSLLLLIERAADGTETAVLRRPGTDYAAVTAEIRVRAAAAQPPLPGVLVDLAFCEWVDSGVLGAWVSWYHDLAARGGRVVVCRANVRIRNILHISQLDRLFLDCPTLADGEARLREPLPPL